MIELRSLVPVKPPQQLRRRLLQYCMPWRAWQQLHKARFWHYAPLKREKISHSYNVSPDVAAADRSGKQSPLLNGLA